VYNRATSLRFKLGEPESVRTRADKTQDTKVVGLLGIGLDNEDGHQRITRGTPTRASFSILSATRMAELTWPDRGGGQDSNRTGE
jgi:hypothetical protein